MKALPRGKQLTEGEVKAWRAGYLCALGDVELATSERRIRIAARSEDLQPPAEWPVRPARAVRKTR